MRVWICSYDYDYEGDTHLAVVSSFEKAKELERLWNENPNRNGDSFSIDDYELDDLQCFNLNYANPID